MPKYSLFAVISILLPFLSIGQGTLTLSITGYDAKCNGSLNGSAKATITGGVAPYTYLWSPSTGSTDSISGLVPGTYSLTVTDSIGDSISGSIIINQPPPITAVIDSIIVPPCFRTTVSVCGCGNTLWAVVTGGTPPYSYLWTPASSTGADTGDTLSAACYDDFTVKVTDKNSCITADSILITIPGQGYYVSGTAGVGQIQQSGGLYTYPNPAGDQLSISLDQLTGGNSVLTVFNIMGGTVLEETLPGNQLIHTIDVTRFAEGNYFLKIVSGESEKISRFSIVR